MVAPLVVRIKIANKMEIMKQYLLWNFLLFENYGQEVGVQHILVLPITMVWTVVQGCYTTQQHGLEWCSVMRVLSRVVSLKRNTRGQVLMVQTGQNWCVTWASVRAVSVHWDVLTTIVEPSIRQLIQMMLSLYHNNNNVHSSRWCCLCNTTTTTTFSP